MASVVIDSVYRRNRTLLVSTILASFGARIMKFCTNIGLAKI